MWFKFSSPPALADELQTAIAKLRKAEIEAALAVIENQAQKDAIIEKRLYLEGAFRTIAFRTHT